MRRWGYRAAFCVILLALPVWAQHRGGGGGGHFAASGGSGGHSSGGSSFAGRSFAGRSSVAHSSGSIRGGSLVRRPGVRVQIGNSFYQRRAVYGRRSYCPYGIYCPYLGYYGYYDPLYDTEDQDSYADAYSQAPYRENGEVQRDAQVDLEARDRPKPGPEPATALVFRDQHVEEVRNYAIAGGTLWVLNSSAGKKISLDDLDLVATAKVNDARGVDFQVPK
jgi:hypothetical protein